jgi:hypothetical protein
MPPDRFNGSGLYALYYRGPFPLYAPVSGTDAPVYAGKASERSTRIGAVGAEGRKLWNRINKHSQSIRQTENLRLEDSCRYLITSDVWVVLGEQGLLSTYGPLWNVVLDGFGNNDPGAGRYDQAVSSWDTLHPGRPWVGKLNNANPRGLEGVQESVREALQRRATGMPPPEERVDIDADSD